MTSLLLIYPFFLPRRDRSVFRFPPLGIGYLAAALQRAGHQVQILDCTFLTRDEALHTAGGMKVDVIGIYCMVTMVDECLLFARSLRSACKLLVAGGPLPTCEPELFVKDFDIVVRGEGEQTLLELIAAFETGADYRSVTGIAYRDRSNHGSPEESEIVYTPDRPFEKDLDSLPFPARQLLPNQEYIRYGRKKHGHSTTTVMSTRGCPYACEFCSNVIFGGSYRQRSASNVIDEIEQALSLGYERISFADDVFTLNRRRVLEICAEIRNRGLHFEWECLGRVDAIDFSLAQTMKTAGCTRIYFGIESGDEQILELMQKKITPKQARRSVEAAHQAGLETAAFFILFYPGETDETVLRTLHFAASLPLDYLGLSMPYPLPGTRLYERMKNKIRREWRSSENLFGNHMLTYQSDFSEVKMWFGILKGQIQFRINRHAGRLAPFLLKIFEKPTDTLLTWMK